MKEKSEKKKEHTSMSEVMIVLIAIYAGLMVGIPLGIGLDEIYHYLKKKGEQDEQRPS